MPNVEIKASYNDHQKALKIAQELDTEYVGTLHQIDTYYNTKHGRIKLREINGESAQLIPYYKEYSKGPMKSSYALLPVDEPEELKEILNKTLGLLSIVDKVREVYLLDNIRIHIDKVKGLGSFIEFEAVYKGEEKREGEVEKLRVLMEKFQIEQEQLKDRSYIDYLLEASDVIEGRKN
ncbi:class IV adenylate cyclase [Bacteriovorax sp. DB6_IX]|uniref:class IV adenylate cyclase n=1 Tax=Bacteriovorax sp. DB6_IX TaxID=1353530 RepID=UPI00038A44DA|nr:class IV adenylate cyclase [Bacteriovorax sp. DB6_IX]EQC52619.1 putative adenylyl cyclase CyaB [Bacteriovorax sp. DB6_IX]